MTPKDHLQAWITKQGGIPQAARALGIPYQTLYSVVSGWRGVSQEQARAWHVASGGSLDANTLVWIRPTRKPGDTAQKSFA